MKSFLPLLSLAFLASCTSAYKTGQTPDDVYYSPTRPQDAYVHTETRQDRQERKYESDRRDDRYDEDYYYDRYLRMKIRNRSRWSTIDNEWYSYNPYYYRNQYYYSYSSPWSYQQYWNHCYNPYAPVVIVHQSSPLYRRPRTSNLHVFDNPGTPSNTPKGPSRGRTYESSRNDQQRGDMGRSLRDLFRESGSSGSSQPSSTGGTTTTSGSRGSSSSGSSSSGSSSSGSKGTGGTAPVRRF